MSYSELVKAWLSTSLQSLGIKKPHIRATVYYYKMMFSIMWVVIQIIL